MAWRRSIGIADDEMVIAFLGRVVMEKGLDVFADAIHAFATCGLKYRVLVIGEGPARPWFEQQLPDAIFLGQQTGDDLARALASADVFLNPSITEAFGNVTLEAMACALPVLAAEATGARISCDPALPARSSTGPSRTSSPKRSPLMPASRTPPQARRGRSCDCKDHGLGHDQLGRDPRLQARHRQT